PEPLQRTFAEGNGDGEVADRLQGYLGAQLVELQAAQQIGCALGFTVEQEDFTLLREEELVQELALRCQEGAPDRTLSCHTLDIVGDDTLQKAAPVGARHLDD